MSSDSDVSAPPPPPSSPAKDRNSDAVALGLKLQSSGPIPKTTTMIQMNHDRPSPSLSPPKQTGGPLSTNPVMACRSMKGNVTTYHDDNILPPAAAAAAAASCGTISSSENTTALQPFDISDPSTPFNYPGGGTEMAATMEYPFTAAQWKELERQAMIYKYMVASVPVPYELLLPIAQNLPASHTPLVNQLRYSRKQDPEPGRCKRTDGKKWRCSRDVAPNQKYCERHMHRGRPRSRKHVEPSQNPENNSKKTRLQNPCVESNPCKVVGSTILPSANETSLLLDRNNPKLVESRGLDWRMGSESEQQWRQIMQTSHSVFHHDLGEDPPLNLLPFTDFGASHDFLGSETPRRGFIDAWSNDKIKDSSVSSNGNLSPSGLKLSMAMAFDNAIEDDFGQIQMRLGGPDPEHPKPNHLLSPVSWAGSTPGGPLAEVLRPSAVAQYHVGDGDSTSTSPQTTTVSSPSGVLQRTMLSLSDSSVCNSPTVAASSTPAPEIVGFQWFT